MENFDCTQFISFENQYNKDEILGFVKSRFQKIGFKIIEDANMRGVKKEYFSQYFGENIIELMNEEFLGEFYEWREIASPPLDITRFAEEIENIFHNYDIEQFKIIFTYFAEKEDTSIEKIVISKDNIIEGLFYVSPNNYDVWADNYVLEII